MTLKELEAQALDLTSKERARLAHLLLGSLESLSEAECAALWAEEAARRDAEAEADPSQETSAEQSLREARDLLR